MVHPPEPVILAEIVLELLAWPASHNTSSLPPVASVPLVMLAPPSRINPAGSVPSPSVSVLPLSAMPVPFWTLSASALRLPVTVVPVMLVLCWTTLVLVAMRILVLLPAVAVKPLAP